MEALIPLKVLSNGLKNCPPRLENWGIASLLGVHQTLHLCSLFGDVSEETFMKQLCGLTCTIPVGLCFLPPTLFCVFVMPVVLHFNWCSLKGQKMLVLLHFNPPFQKQKKKKMGGKSVEGRMLIDSTSRTMRAISAN